MRVNVSSPGRVCLLGEHQDYFGLNIIAAAFNRQFTIEARQAQHHELRISLPDIGVDRTLSLGAELPYQRSHDYLASVHNVLFRRGLRWSEGWDVVMRSDVPMGKGVSSSSAMCVAWTAALGAMADVPAIFDAGERAELAVTAEVLEFGAPGGKMDQYSSSVGRLIHLGCTEPVALTPLAVDLPGLVLADSLAVKDTTGVLASNKGDVHSALAEQQRREPGFTLAASSSAALREQLTAQPQDATERRWLRLLGTLESREQCEAGFGLLRAAHAGETLDLSGLATCINAHHETIRDRLGLSTPAIEAIRNAALGAGAIAAKIVGSGGGGCVVLLAPGRESEAIEAVVRSGGSAQRVEVCGGTTVERG